MPFAVRRTRSLSGSDVKIRNHIHKDWAPRGHTAEAAHATTLPCVFRVFFSFKKQFSFASSGQHHKHKHLPKSNICQTEISTCHSSAYITS